MGGSGLGCHGLALLYETGRGVVQDESRAVEFYEKSCDARFAEGCARLGQMRARQRGEEAQAQTLRDFASGCARSHRESCAQWMQLNEAERVRVGGDTAVTSRLQQRACGFKDGLACFRVGQAHAAGKAGRAQDAELAAMYYRLACRHGEAQGCAALER